MILYTIYDSSIIFNNFESDINQAQHEMSEIDVEGVKLQVTDYGNSEMRVERIISTNPADYLNPKFQPGCIIKRGR